MAHIPIARRVTMQDIARATGYSVNTVSHALRNMGDIAPGTAERIRQAAREMGYTGNALASSLRSGRTRALALILGSMSNPFYSIMTDTLQTVASDRGYDLLIMCSREDAERELKLIDAAAARRVDGVLLFPSGDSLRSVERLKALRIPFVLMSRALGEGVADSVISDESRGAWLAVRHLIGHGRRSLGYLARQRIVFSYDRRLAGFNRACDDGGIPSERRRVYVAESGGTEDRGLARTRDCLVRWRAEGVDGLFVFCDVEAWHVQSLIQQTPGLQGWDVGIVGFDNIQGTQHYPIGLCSVDCDFEEMARQGIDLLRSRIHGDPQPPRIVVCPVRLVCHGSC